MPAVALVHDYVVERGGSERVLLSMHAAFPDAEVRTAFFRPEATFAEFARVPVRPFAIDRLEALRRRHRLALPVLPFVFGRARIDADVVVCGTSGWSAGVGTTGRKVLYVHAPTRWLNDQADYLAGRPTLERLGLRAVERPLRAWDRRAVLSGDRHLAPSRAVQAVLRDVYGVEAEVLPPPVALAVDGPAVMPTAAPPSGFVLCVARLVANKNVDVVVEAFRRRPHDHLVVAGGGPLRERLEVAAPANVTFVGSVDDDGLRWLYRACRSVVSAANESFGLAAAEAAAFGRPAAVLGPDGPVDTVVDDVTGVRFAQPDAEAVADAVDRVDRLPVERLRLRSHAARWSESSFVSRLREVVAEVAGQRASARS